MPRKKVQEVDVTIEDTKPRKRFVPTKVSVMLSLDSLIEKVDDYTDKLRTGDVKNTGIRFLKSIKKDLKQLRSHNARVLKQKRKINRSSESKSGFQKPVQISDEFIKFAGWKKGQLYSRVDVTRFLCDYVKTNKLQDPDCGKNIMIAKDKKFCKLLRYNPKKDPPLTYPLMQRYVKPHFVKSE